MSHPHEWCRTLEHHGTTVLLMRGWNGEYERPMMTTTFQIDHLIAGDTDFGQTSITHMKTDEDAEPFTDREWEEYCAPEAVQERVDQVVSSVLGHQHALH